MRRYVYRDDSAESPVPGARVGLDLEPFEAGRPGPGEVQVAIRANSLNFVDLNCFSGAFPVQGRVPLLDGAGEVLAVGEGVERFGVGDRVVGNPHSTWLAGPPSPSSVGSVLGITVDGMLAEVVTKSADVLVRIPDGIGLKAAASLPCAGLSAWNSLMGGASRYFVPPGGTVLTQGTGGVSLFAVQFARAMGCRVIATTSTQEKAATLESLGAEAVVNYVETPDWGRRVLELTGGEGVDLVVEVGGPTTLPQSITAARAGGRIAMVGIVGGLGSLDYRNLLPINHKVLTLYANGMGSRADLEAMLRFVESNGIDPFIDSVFPFENAAEAISHFAHRRHVGKVIIGEGE
jgi:NADPH:quinone reductase-like Zn-dependent oxidoreductase